jgi:hypothetical protein
MLKILRGRLLYISCRGKHNGKNKNIGILRFVRFFDRDRSKRDCEEQRHAGLLMGALNCNNNKKQ